MTIKKSSQKSTQNSDELEFQSDTQSTLEMAEKIYQQHSQEIPSTEIDKQILAAAQREILNPNKKEILKNSWWRRLTLPLYAMATFAVTAVAVNVLMPKQVRIPPGTSSGPVKIDIIDDSMSQINSEAVIQPRISRDIPDKPPLIDLPKLSNSSNQPLNDHDMLGDVKLDGMKMDNIEPPLINGQTTNASQTPMTQHASLDKNIDKDKWAREIINLLKNGDYRLAKTELTEFKKVYPDYPIDEQIETFRP